MKTRLAVLLCAALLAPAVAFADPWKDESGHVRGRGGWYGETPGRARGRGYWDGHFRHAPPPRVYGGWYVGPPVVEYHWYAVPPPPPYYGNAYRGFPDKRWRDWDDD